MNTKPKQMTMAGTQTEFSDAADAYILACEGVELAEKKRVAAMSVLIEFMRKHRIKHMKHEGRTLELRLGSKRMDTVAVR